MKLEIPIGEKLVAKNLPQIIDKYWNSSIECQYIVFDLSDTDWISNSEILTVIGWINHLKNRGKSVAIQLQKQKNDSVDSVEYKRKKYFQYKLLSEWKIRMHIPKDVKIFDGDIPVKQIVFTSFNEIFKIPIIKHEPSTFDSDFKSLFNNENLGIYKSQTKLLDETNLNYFDSDFLSYSIIKELYSNVCIHSDLETFENCFFSLSINRKISYVENNKYGLALRMAELSEMEKTYFIDNEEYKNINYVELNFQDFGVGITSSLKEKYLSDENNLEAFFGKEYKLHLEQNEDSRIIHYSLLLFTSRYEIDRKFEIHDFIPRGLFILKELTEKYQGYIEIFSGYGAMGISFKGGKEKICFANPKSKLLIFNGTRIRIVFPSKDDFALTDKFEKTGKQLIKTNENFKQIKQGENTFYLNLLSIYQSAECLINAENNDETDINILIASLFFQILSKQISSKPLGSLFLLDFAGMDKGTRDVFNKFIYFITHTPTNASYRIILFNVLIRDLNSTFVLNKKNESRSEGFFPYPVPVIFPDNDIAWLGIEDAELSKILTEIWIGDSSRELHFDDNIVRFSSSILQFERYKGYNKIVILLPLFNDLTFHISDLINDFLMKEIVNNEIEYKDLKDEKHNYNIILKKKDGVVFHTSNGNYQDRYLSFNDKLYIPSYRRMIATFLLFKTNILGIDIKNTDKILSVTLSSQFIAHEFKKIFSEFFYREVELISLSNYYSFHNERRFKDIKKGDRVLVINDIISTGKLTENIFYSLEKIEAEPICCMAIANLSNEVQRIKFNYDIVSLVDYEVETSVTKPKGTIAQWINPILNIPVTIKKEKKDINTLLTKTEFHDMLDEEVVLVGNMKNNSYYLTYYIDTLKLLINDQKRGFKLLNTILSRLKEKKREANNSELKNISRGIKIVSNDMHDDEKRIKLEKIAKSIDKLSTPTIFADYKIDLIFYPFLSNIGLLEEDLRPFQTSGLNEGFPSIYPIPRIQTERGWRFTFPPKFLNVMTSTRNLSVLIIDDGSNTGSSLMQMIDSIAFLSVKSIDIISIFGTLEDYKKELLSRLKSIKVKNNVIPINTYFGIHFNLSVHNERENPYLIEANEIDQLREMFNKDIPGQSFKLFLEKYRANLINAVFPQDLEEEYPIFEQVSKKNMLDYRDVIGLFDSYRFYSEDLPEQGGFDYLTSSNESMLTLLSVLNLEPTLYKTIKRLLPPEIILKIFDSIFSFLNDEKFNNSFNRQMFFIKALGYIIPHKFVDNVNLERLVSIFSKHHFEVDTYHYLNYQLLLVLFQIRNIEDVVTIRGFRSNIVDFLSTIKETQQQIHHKYFRFFAEILRDYYDKKDNNAPKPINIYLKLSSYYLKTQNNEGSHEDKLLLTHFNEPDGLTNDILAKFSSDPNYIITQEENDNFFNSLDNFLDKYYEDYPEYSYIKRILEDLQNYGTYELEFNPNKLFRYINEFEQALDFNKVNENSLNNLLENIKRYRETFLLSKSVFAKFILDQKSNIEETWDLCENQINDPNYVPISKKTDLNYFVLVNKFVLMTAFKNLIRNKNKYAQSAIWEILVNNDDQDRIELLIIQHSAFVEGGDGTAFKSIKEFLYFNGTFYKRMNKNPYTLRINLPLKK